MALGAPQPGLPTSIGSFDDALALTMARYQPPVPALPAMPPGLDMPAQPEPEPAPLEIGPALGGAAPLATEVAAPPQPEPPPEPVMQPGALAPEPAPQFGADAGASIVPPAPSQPLGVMPEVDSVTDAALAQPTPAPPPPAPEPQAPSPIETAPATFEGAEALGRGALVQKEQAQEIVVETEAAKADAAAAELARRNAAAEELRQKRETERIKEEQQIERYRAEADKATDTWAKYKIDEGRRWRNASTARKIGAGIAVAMSALGDVLQRKSGPNMALQIIHDGIKEDVQAQLREREGLKEIATSKRGSIDDYIKSTGRKEDAFNLKMGEELKRSAMQLEQQAAAFGAPEAKARAMTSAAALRQEAAAYLGQVAQGKYERERAKEAAAAAERNRRDQLNLSYASLNQSDRHHRDAMRAKERDQLLEAARYQAAANAKQAEEDRKLSVGGGSFKEVAVDGKTVKVPDVIRNHDGSPFRAASEPEARELRDGKAAVDTINDFVGQIVRGIKKHGGESDYFKSADWMRQKSRIAFAKNAIRVGEKMGTLDSGSEKLMDQMAGAVDPVSFWRDASPGLIQMRDNLVTGFNNRLRAQGLTGDGYQPPDTTNLPPPEASEADKLQERAMADPWKVEDGAQQLGITGAEGGNPGMLYADRLRASGGILPSAKAGIDALTIGARSGDSKTRQRMLDGLASIAKNAPTQAQRDYAAEQIEVLKMSTEFKPSREPLPGEQ